MPTDQAQTQVHVTQVAIDVFGSQLGKQGSAGITRQAGFVWPGKVAQHGNSTNRRHWYANNQSVSSVRQSIGVVELKTQALVKLSG